MRIPLTKFGLPQVIAAPAIFLMMMCLFAYDAKFDSDPMMPRWILISVAVFCGLMTVWSLSFFRDPYRKIPDNPNLLLSPADGTITDIETVTDQPDLPGEYLRIGIFLSIFNVHINRTPCPVKIDKVTYKKGRYTNALNPLSGKVNEANDVLMTRLDDPKDTLLVRQISGAIARRIVCDLQIGQEFTGGYRFGMLKFGSRTELYLPVRQDIKCLVKVKDKVKAGLTILARYEK